MRIYKKDVLKKEKNLKKLYFNNFLNIFLFSFFNLLFFYKHRNFFYDENKKNILIAQGISNLIISKLINFISLKKIKIIYFNGDILPENASETNLNNKNYLSIQNYVLFCLYYFLRFIILKTTKIMYDNNKILLWDKKKFGKIKEYFKVSHLFDYDLINIKKYNNKKVIEFLHLGNIEKSNGILDVINVMIKLKSSNISSRLTVVSSNSKEILKNYEILNLINKYNLKLRLLEFLEYKKLKKIILNSTYGMALYFFNNKKRKSSAFNGKVYFYLKNNLPVISTNYCYFKGDIQKNSMGICSNNYIEIINYIKKNDNIKINLIKKNIHNYMKKKSDLYHSEIVLKKLNKI